MELKVECGELYDRIKTAICAKKNYQVKVPDDTWTPKKVPDAKWSPMAEQTELDRPLVDDPADIQPLIDNPETDDDFLTRMVLLDLTGQLRTYERARAIAAAVIAADSEIEEKVTSIVKMGRA
jgi:hypothetical protein